MAMQDNKFEPISAVADGELGTEELRFLLRRVERDPEARDALARYHAVSAAVHHEYVPGAGSLADRVRASIDGELAHTAPEASAQVGGATSRWLRPVGGMAIAASVALGVLIVGPTLFDTGNPAQGPVSEPSVAVIQGAPVEGQLERVATSSGRQSAATGAVPIASASLDAEARQRLSAYFVNHSEYAADGQLGTPLKYARIMGHGSER